MTMERRQFLTASVALGAAAAAPNLMASNTAPSRYPDSTWQVIDERFERYMLFNTPLERQWTGGLWLEGPAWNAVGRYAVFSDIPRARQMRWDEVTGEVSVLRHKVGHSNGNTFDNRGRLIACEHSPARVVRYEWDGSMSVLAERYDDKPLNAPNDVVALESGGLIFTDPGYGAHIDYEGQRRELQLDTAVYYWEDGMAEPKVLTTELYKPNGIALGPDGRSLYITDTAPSHHPDQPATITRFTLAEDGKALQDPQRLVESREEGYDGLTCDADGNLWVGTSGGEGIDGVSIFAPDGTLIGRVLLPEICANVCFTGEDRNRLLMTASQSIYTLYTAARGA
ncbi:SMP-30/gluconolactonase/LRE family protein [Halomonas eurihalina]|uniref:SMP-30/gluconolactonase/LRE family protein n=1 Tax=Halomonas eurihalina TaxID=42566 RepID=A0A5D9D939_HALER|nr:SMP-30/gluconolactonase/LRE family protein [Halomonas eurihalina]MDR5860007.1 SMP-30/gluconolactonase/LRE family protein [Halomonas eurihalina]TZG39812.1 SMP-30/gluconolactonase/LRE family protein [Halomonas eurihalina]